MRYDHYHQNAHKESTDKDSVVYTCPMHPEIKQDKPGMCPECGMNLIATKHEEQRTRNKSDGYDKHAGHSTMNFLKKFWVSLVLTIPVVLYADIVQKIFKWSPPDFAGSKYLVLILGSVVFFYGGWIFLVGAYREIRAKLPGMMTLIGIAISAAYLWSIYAAFGAPEHTLFWELTTLITIMLLGHYIEMKSVQGAQRALKELSKLLPDVAEVVRNGKNEQIPLSELKVDDIVFVRPGAKIPSDGVVIEGTSEINESMITGESKPVAKNVGSEVIAGTINGDGSLRLKVSKIGEHTFLAGVMRFVADAQASKSRLQILSDKAAFYLTIIAIGGGSVTFLAWFLSAGDFSFAVERLVAVLVIACPHALGLAVPLVAAISTTLAARHGFLVRERQALEAARNIDFVLFDKTGTLTKGEYGVSEIIPADAKENEILQIAASLDSHSEHFIAKAIVGSANDKKLNILEVKNFQRIAGKGIKGLVNGVLSFVGGESILEETRVRISDHIKPKIEELAKQGKTIIYVISDSKLLGAIALADIIREESLEAINKLKGLGVKTAMLTGDTENVAKWVSKQTGIDECFAKILPENKSAKVKMLQSRGFKVAMVGDGINDAPALTQADLGIAIGAGTNVAIESAGIILVRNDPRDIVRIIRLSRATYKKMIQNLWWASGYNIIAMPLAAGVLASKGIILEPALAALFMSLSTVIVAINAVLLKSFENQFENEK